jgi:hypothetical protein
MVELAIMHHIRSVMLVKVYDEDFQTGGRRPIKLCHRLQSCQSEVDKFNRLFDEDSAEFERFWIGDMPDSDELIRFVSGRLGGRRKNEKGYRNKYILVNEF